MAWEFKKTWPESWSFRGEVSYNGYEETIIDLSKPDWRMDIVKKDPDGKKKSVLPGIFKFENDTLIWATSSHWTNFSEEGEYETRPTTFESTGKNERTVRHLRPWKEYLDEVKK